MLIYKKENGFPVSLFIETSDAEDKKEEWKGYESVVFDEDHNEVGRFFHNDFRARVFWAEGFFKGFLHKDNPESIPQKIEKLKKALEEMKVSNKAAWDVYGSELCVNQMLSEEEKLEKEIEDLEKFQEDLSKLPGLPDWLINYSGAQL
jgi:hypothetical protein